jgi:hypothetical protein
MKPRNAIWWCLPIGDFLECLYARTYMQISSNYPNICPQEMGIISEMKVFRNQEKLKF